MKIKQYDTVKLKNGYKAVIVEIFKENEDYLADIDYPKGTETEMIKHKDIESILND